MKKMWMLRRIREVGGSQEDLLTVYKLQIRCRTELACPTWNGSLTNGQVKKLEHIQKVACHVILGKRYLSYKKALQTLNIPTLAERRKILCTKFAKKTSENI